MGIFKKLVDILSDEVEETEEISETKKEESKREKKENKKEKQEEVVAISPKKEVEVEEPKKEEQTERGLYQSKDTFKFPVFDDEDIDKTLQRSRSTNVMEYEKTKASEVPSVPSIPNIPSMTMPRREEPKSIEAPVEKKAFRPSPVISPVYGILDKNYTKDEIIDKKEEEQRSIPKDNLNYDSVRRKAYGTLEDDLEDTLMSLNKKEMKKVEEIHNDIEELNDPKKHIEKLLDELEKTASMTVGEIEEALKEELDDTVEIENTNDISEFDEEISSKIHSDVENDLEFTSEFKPKDREETKTDDKELENDLFNLIDSMYNEGDE